MNEPHPWKPATIAVHSGGEPPASGDIAPPVQPTTTYLKGNPAGDVYTRENAGGPGVRRPETALRELEGGAAAALFSSGMAAATSLFLTLPPGANVVVPRVMYWLLRNWLTREGSRHGLQVGLYNAGDVDSLAAAVTKGRTRAIWVETPSNPLWQVTDLAAAAEIADQAGARLWVDNTVPTPILTRPLDLGADVVMHSATKYLNGHSDVLGGALVTAHEGKTWEAALAHRTELGGMLGGFEAWLLLRGMRTLELRVGRQSENALKVAAALEGKPGVKAVLYPGLASHPGHEAASRQMQGGFGGMLSIRVDGGYEAAAKVATRTRLFRDATSLGGVESLIEHRAAAEGRGGPTPDDLLRLSVGIEDPDDLIDDLVQAIGRK